MLQLAGMVFGRWTVLSDGEPYVSPNGNGPHSRWECRCQCGTIRLVFEDVLLSGRSQSCGCLANEMRASRWMKHGHCTSRTVSPEYTSWRCMMARCRNPKNKHYPEYGGRGITVCDRWNTFGNFFADMGSRPSKGHTMDRIDPNGNYEPGNCRWASVRTQQGNRRNTVLMTFSGRTMPLTDWADLLGMKPNTIVCRLRSGMSDEEALSTPVATRTRRAPGSVSTEPADTVTVAEAASIAGVSTKTVYKHIHSGAIRVVECGHPTRVLACDVGAISAAPVPVGGALRWKSA